MTAYKEQSLVMHCGNDHACVNFIKQEAVFVMATIQSYLSSPQSVYDFVDDTGQHQFKPAPIPGRRRSARAIYLLLGGSGNLESKRVDLTGRVQNEK